MKIVTGVEVMECTPMHGANNIVRIAHNGVLENEEVVGKTFINSKGEKIIIGISKVVQETLGLPILEFERIDNEMKNLRKAYFKAITDFIEANNKIQKLEEIITKGAKADFFRRFQYFITGKFKYLIH